MKTMWQRFLNSNALGWVAIVLLIALWQVGVMAGYITSPELPSPSHLAAVWWQELAGQSLGAELLKTLSWTFSGFGLALIFGVSIGVAMGCSKIANGLLEPFIELIRPVPISALIPLVILFVGIGFKMKLFVALLGAIFPVVINTWSGVRTVSNTLRDTGTTFGLTWIQSVREVYLPAASPSIFTGLRLGLATALVITVVSEMIAGSSGVGFYILSSQQSLGVDQMYAGLMTLAVVGYGLNAAFVSFERWMLFWAMPSIRSA
jgi:ABC-type nitrate/sulfonate/bicarbonate transport system permease component